MKPEIGRQKARMENIDIKYLSLGMSDDYPIAVQEGANMVRIGSKIFS